MDAIEYHLHYNTCAGVCKANFCNFFLKKALDLQNYVCYTLLGFKEALEVGLCPTSDSDLFAERSRLQSLLWKWPTPKTAGVPYGT